MLHQFRMLVNIAAPFGNFGGQLGKTINNGHGVFFFGCPSAVDTARVGPSGSERQMGKVAVVPNAFVGWLATTIPDPAEQKGRLCLATFGCVQLFVRS